MKGTEQGGRETDLPLPEGGQPVNTTSGEEKRTIRPADGRSVCPGKPARPEPSGEAGEPQTLSFRKKMWWWAGAESADRLAPGSQLDQGQRATGGQAQVPGETVGGAPQRLQGRPTKRRSDWAERLIPMPPRSLTEGHSRGGLADAPAHERTGPSDWRSHRGRAALRCAGSEHWAQSSGSPVPRGAFLKNTRPPQCQNRLFVISRLRLGC